MFGKELSNILQNFLTEILYYLISSHKFPHSSNHIDGSPANNPTN